MQWVELWVTYQIDGASDNVQVMRGSDVSEMSAKSTFIDGSLDPPSPTLENVNGISL